MISNSGRFLCFSSSIRLLMIFRGAELPLWKLILFGDLCSYNAQYFVQIRRFWLPASIWRLCFFYLAALFTDKFCLSRNNAAAKSWSFHSVHVVAHFYGFASSVILYIQPGWGTECMSNIGLTRGKNWVYIVGHLCIAQPQLQWHTACTSAISGRRQATCVCQRFITIQHNNEITCMCNSILFQ